MSETVKVVLFSIQIFYFDYSLSSKIYKRKLSRSFSLSSHKKFSYVVSNKDNITVWDLWHLCLLVTCQFTSIRISPSSMSFLSDVRSICVNSYSYTKNSQLKYQERDSLSFWNRWPTWLLYKTFKLYSSMSVS